MSNEDLLDEGLEETFPASDPVATVTPPAITDNRQLHRFEAQLDGETAHLRYKREGGLMHLVHTEVPEAMRSRGIGSELVRYALEAARHEGLEVKVVCPFVHDFIERHPEYETLVSE